MADPLYEEIMNLESKNLEDYLVSDEIVGWETPNNRQKAFDLTRELEQA